MNEEPFETTNGAFEVHMKLDKRSGHKAYVNQRLVAFGPVLHDVEKKVKSTIGPGLYMFFRDFKLDPYMISNVR